MGIDPLDAAKNVSNNERVVSRNPTFKLLKQLKPFKLFKYHFLKTLFFFFYSLSRKSSHLKIALINCLNNT